MSAQAESPPIDARRPPLRAARWWRAVDRALEWVGDRLNPILVKETRQALKSKQFTITFGLLLALGWVWSILGVALMRQDLTYGSLGADMFFGYYFILAFPLLVIVPFGAFRSLAVEQEDRTYELMSITTLTPGQIARGKLGSAVLQMVVYLSAISPCLGFTYMLRGIDFPSILFILSYTVLSSLALSVVALLLGTLTSERHWQVVLSVLLIAGLFGALITAIAMTGELLDSSRPPFTDPDFWVGSAAWLTGYLTYLMLLFYAAVAQITFPSDNRSTRLRIVMLVQHVLFVGWMAWAWIAFGRNDPEILIVFLVFIGLHWYAMGAFMTGESSQLSPRVKRQLPQSFLGRVFLTWFNPGPGTGYVFAVCNLAAALVMALIGLVVGQAFGLFPQRPWTRGLANSLPAFGILGLSYVVIYLGLGLLLVRLLRRFTYVGIVLGVMIQVLLVLLGSGVPLIIHLMSPLWRNDNYNLLHVTDPIWSLGHVITRSSLSADAYVLLVVVPAAALAVFLANLPGVARELRHVRIVKPKRVAEEDAQRLAAKRPPQPVKTSPWD